MAAGASRIFLCVLCAALAMPCPAAAGDVGKRFPSEKRTLVDAKTAVTITALTSSAADDVKLYQTHPQWTADGKWIVFYSKRSGTAQVFAVNEASGTIVQLTDGPDTDAFVNRLCLSRKQNRLYFFRGGRGQPARLIQLDLDPLLYPGAAQNPAADERVIMALPADLQISAGGLSLDADERHIYVGVSRDGQPHRSGIRSIDLATGQLGQVLDVPFRVGHVQGNPWVPGEILYCDETGGDVPQRMWLTHVGSAVTQPLYKETPDEWVTHEVVVQKDHALFIISGHLPKLRTKPTGMALINLRTQEMHVIGQVPGPGFSHCAASPDLKWAVGDTFAGDLYLINIATGACTLWSTGHRPKEVHAHQNFSPDGRRLLFASGLLGHAHLMTIELPPQ
jgi:oligogalacturonide lyase